MNPLTSKREDWSYIIHGQYDVSHIANMVYNFDKEWEIDTYRQTIYKTHADTRCLNVKKMRIEWVLGTPGFTETVYYFEEGPAKNQIDFIIKDLEEKNNGRLINFEIVGMNPNSRIRTHRDRGDTVYYARRIHVPIITNPDVFFTVGGNEIHMETGIAYEINNARWHSARNRSNLERVHFIMDIMPNEYCGTIDFR
jgi:hypothetical protein